MTTPKELAERINQIIGDCVADGDDIVLTVPFAREVGAALASEKPGAKA